LSFAFDFVPSEFSAPAWRNWQTRWTQNPVAARPCGFEPLRRQVALNVGRWTLGVKRVSLNVPQEKIQRCLDSARHDNFGKVVWVVCLNPA
jgi:hypothetical protein